MQQEQIEIKNPLNPKNIFNALFQPHKIFAPHIRIAFKPWWFFVFFVISVFCMVALLILTNEEDLLKIKNNLDYYLSFSYILITFSICLISLMPIWLIIWYINSWFFNLTLKWSGASNFDKTEPKLIFFYIFSIIILLITIPSLMLNKANFTHFLEVISIYGTVLLYLAMKNKYSLKGMKPIFWFLIFPLTINNIWSIKEFIGKIFT